MAEYQNEREIVLEILMEVMEQGKPSHLVLRQALDKYDWMERNRKAFISKCSLGTMDRIYELDAVLDAYSNTPVRKMKPLIRSLLRMSTYQILYMEKVPDSAVCNEAVKIAKAHSFGKLSGFVNGVLRTVSRENQNHSLKYQTEHSDLALQYSMPEWIISMLQETYGEQTETILKGMTGRMESTDDTLTFTALTARTPLEETLKMFEADGVAVEPDADIDRILHCRSVISNPADLTAIQNGSVIIQDKSSALCALAVDPAPGSIMMDACAAPGGKSLVAADLMQGTGWVYACDLTEFKCSLIRENADRTHTDNLKVIMHDALEQNEKWVGRADLVLADLPCSGLGIIRNKTDIRYHMTPEKQQDLVQLQQNMLRVLQSYVKPGGRLIYSTCTVHPAENIGNRNWFLQEFGDFTAEPVSDRVPAKYRQDTGKDGYVQLLPGVDDTDGFFFACFRKTAE